VLATHITFYRYTKALVLLELLRQIIINDGAYIYVYEPNVLFSGISALVTTGSSE
jgi:hypothetical protein